MYIRRAARTTTTLSIILTLCLALGYPLGRAAALDEPCPECSVAIPILSNGETQAFWGKTQDGFTLTVYRQDTRVVTVEGEWNDRLARVEVSVTEEETGANFLFFDLTNPETAPIASVVRYATGQREVHNWAKEKRIGSIRIANPGVVFILDSLIVFGSGVVIAHQPGALNMLFLGGEDRLLPLTHYSRDTSASIETGLEKLRSIDGLGLLDTDAEVRTNLREPELVSPEVESPDIFSLLESGGQNLNGAPTCGELPPCCCEDKTRPCKSARILVIASAGKVNHPTGSNSSGDYSPNMSGAAYLGFKKGNPCEKNTFAFEWDPSNGFLNNGKRLAEQIDTLAATCGEGANINVTGMCAGGVTTAASMEYIETSNPLTFDFWNAPFEGATSHLPFAGNILSVGTINFSLNSSEWSILYNSGLPTPPTTLPLAWEVNVHVGLDDGLISPDSQKGPWSEDEVDRKEYPEGGHYMLLKHMDPKKC